MDLPTTSHFMRSANRNGVHGRVVVYIVPYPLYSTSLHPGDHQYLAMNTGHSFNDPSITPLTKYLCANG